ncbi:hypothetical protein GE09DRAFT_203936 [Coniochaeta sp. 2T2.1]|nr:hypothetical protein GE09DRAFT_203936 [Coniochaeta sp. 2T2.1]
MSHYPYGYGHYPGHPPPPHAPPRPNQYAYHPPQGAYTPMPPMPAYGAPHDPNAPPPPPPNYYAMTQAAYDYNSSIPAIPGLGVGGPPVAGTPYQVPPPPPSWGQSYQAGRDADSRYAASTPNVPSQQYGYSGPPQFNGPADQSFQPLSCKNSNNSNDNNKDTQTLPPKPAPPLANEATQDSDEMEEGELSDGSQFEDLYDTVDSSTKGKDTTVIRHMISIPDDSQPASAADTPSGGFYTQEEEDSDSRNNFLKGTGAGVDTGGKHLNGRQHRPDARERSGSYSPYLSPREVEGASTPKSVGRSTNGYQTAKHQTPPTAPNGTGQSRVPGLGQPGNHALVSNTLNGLAPMESATPQTQSTNATSSIDNNAISSGFGFKSLTEAKKEAQKAILRLWPLGVRYKDYIDEGFDENVVKLLFNELHLDLSTGLPIQPDPPQQPHPEPRISAPATSKSPTAQRTTMPDSATKASETAKMDKSEERKDRIARLLADKAAKAKAPAPAPAPTAALAPASIPSPTQATVSTQAVTPAPAPVAAPALPASYAQSWATIPSAAPAPVSASDQPLSSSSYQPSATGQVAVPATTAAPALTNIATTSRSSGVSTPTGPKPKTKEEMERLLRQKMEALQKSRVLGAQKANSEKTNSSPVKSGGVEAAHPATSVPAPTVSANLATAIASPQQQSTEDKGPIPGLFLSGGPASQPINVRKRPVAADFVDYSSSEPRKRPFGQERQGSSLVIDVSDDDSDEEMDIDMDMDSPDETPLPIVRSNNHERKGPSLAEFPPLRDLSRRNISSPAPSAARTPPNGAMSAQELLAKEKAIQEMKRKIAEYEAKQNAKKGSQTPNQATATPSEINENESSGANGPRASSVNVDKIDGPSAQLLSEAVTASLPTPSEPAALENAQADGSRSVSRGGSRVDSALEVRKKKAAALREAREARMREAKARIEAEKARIAEEEARMQEEEARMLAEAEQDEEMEAGSDDDDQSEHMSVDEESEEETRKEEAVEQTAGSQAILVPEASAPQSPGKEPSPPLPTSNELNATEVAASEAQDVPVSEEAIPAPEDHSATPVIVHDNGPAAAVQQHVEEVPIANPDLVIEQVAGSSPDVAAAEPPMNSTGEPGYEGRAEVYEPTETHVQDSVDHVTIPDSPEFSPEPAGDDLSDATGGVEHQAEDHIVPATISDVPHSRAETQEIEGPATSEPQQPAPAPAAPSPRSSFVPYESSLRSFRAFKFHPEFNKLVPGGVKSLTYSNKIDPRKQLCPSELQGGACPRGNDCEFQHLSSIGVSDEQILVELGRADDYTGEQKDRFIQGLRELLQDFRANHVRDFDTIANGIMEFRSRFLGDKTKILPLGDVSL